MIWTYFYAVSLLHTREKVSFVLDIVLLQFPLPVRDLEYRISLVLETVVAGLKVDSGGPEQLLYIFWKRANEGIVLQMRKLLN